MENLCSFVSPSMTNALSFLFSINIFIFASIGLICKVLNKKQVFTVNSPLDNLIEICIKMTNFALQKEIREAITIKFWKG